MPHKGTGASAVALLVKARGMQVGPTAAHPKTGVRGEMSLCR